MVLKVKLIQPREECAVFNAIVQRFRLQLTPLFPGSMILFTVDCTDAESRRQLYECRDVRDLIVDRERSVPV